MELFKGINETDLELPIISMTAAELFFNKNFKKSLQRNRLGTEYSIKDGLAVISKECSIYMGNNKYSYLDLSLDIIFLNEKKALVKFTLKYYSFCCSCPSCQGLNIKNQIKKLKNDLENKFFVFKDTYGYLKKYKWNQEFLDIFSEI